MERVPERHAAFLEAWVRGRTLDVGCGAGAVVGHLARQGHDAVGVDFVSDFIEYAKATYGGQFVRADAGALPFDDSAFDTVLAFDLLEHVDDEQVLREMVRVARDRVVIAVPARTPAAVRETGLVYGHHEDRSHLRYYDEAALRGLLEGAGLRVLEVESADPVNVRLLVRRAVSLGGGLRERLFFRWLRGADVAAWPTTLLAAAERPA